MRSTLHRPDSREIVADRLRDPDTGFYERPAKTSDWPRPDLVEFREGSVYWEVWRLWDDHEDLPRYPHVGSPTRGMLSEFLALEDASLEKILSYARKWGVLETRLTSQQFAHNDAPYSQDGSHRWVTKHNWSSDEHNDLADDPWDARSPRIFGLEPLDGWRYWPKRFAATIRVGGRLSEDECPDSEDWQVMKELDPPPEGLLCQPETNEIDRKINALCLAWKAREFEIADALQKELESLDEAATSGDGSISPVGLATQWAAWKWALPGYFKPGPAIMLAAFAMRRLQRIAGVSLNVDLSTAKPEIQTPTLFAGLVWELMIAFRQSTGFATCSECGVTFPVERKRPSTAQHSPCPSERCRKAAALAYTKDSRRRKKRKLSAAAAR